MKANHRSRWTNAQTYGKFSRIINWM